MTTAGVSLGKTLFFDPILSRDSTLSCADCHRPELAFTDGRSFSRGVAGRRTLRTAPSLLNVGYVTTGLFWDGRAATLEEAVLHPIVDSTEMGNSWQRLIPLLRAHPDYPGSFRQAFDSRAGITREEVGKALAQYLRTLVSASSRYDRYKRGEAALTASEDRGRRIFFDIDPALPAAECGHCHLDPLFNHPGYFNTGLDEINSPYDITDPGRAAVSGLRKDLGAFRTPSLRNIARTAPYMHDGRFATLAEVVDHYNQGGRYAENVNPNVRVLALTEQDKIDLIAFLNTLTDEETVTR